jgi:transposase
MSETLDFPLDLDACHELLRTLSEELAKLRETNGAMQKQVAELEAEQERLRKFTIYLAKGHRRERHLPAPENQPLLPFDSAAEYQEARAEAEAEAATIVQKYEVTRTVKKNKKRIESFPNHLPRVEKIVSADEMIRICPNHGERQLLGYDTTETLMCKPSELYVLVRKYPKFACGGQPDCGVKSPERPTSLVEGDKYDTSVAAKIIDAKWHLHMPIYRQQDVFAGSGWVPSRSTLNNIMMRVIFVLSEFVRFMTNRVKNDIGIGLDDTGCRMLFPRGDVTVTEATDAKTRRLAARVAEAKARGENSLLAKMWVYQGLHLAPYNIFDFQVSRHRDGPDDFLKTSKCVVMGDCFSGNMSVVLSSDERLKFAACWAHARRKVVEANSYKAEREVLLGMIQALYDIERRGKELPHDQRQQLREQESKAVLEAIRTWMDTAPLVQVLPRSDFAEALRYIRNHWDALNLFVTDGRLPIDNNAVEQLMKQVAMGRKAWLFVSSVASGEQSAQLMSVVSSAKRHDLDVWTYVKDLLDQLLAGTTDYEKLLPDVWKQSHPEAVRVYREEERRDKAERKQYEAAQRRLAKASQRD